MSELPCIGNLITVEVCVPAARVTCILRQFATIHCRTYMKSAVHGWTRYGGTLSLHSFGMNGLQHWQVGCAGGAAHGMGG